MAGFCGPQPAYIAFHEFFGPPAQVRGDVRGVDAAALDHRGLAASRAPPAGGFPLAGPLAPRGKYLRIHEARNRSLVETAGTQPFSLPLARQRGVDAHVHLGRAAQRPQPRGTRGRRHQGADETVPKS